jgi:geranylgeranyl pyrophosphate synthase
MQWLTSHYQTVKQVLSGSAPEYWPDLGVLLAECFPEGFSPELVMVLASAKAAGGKAMNAVPAAASVLAASISLRILDDLQDQDRQHSMAYHLGNARTWNYAFVVQAIAFRIIEKAPYPETIGRILRNYLQEGFLRVGAGQDRDLVLTPLDFQEARMTAELKTGTAFATAALMGAACGEGSAHAQNALKEFGYGFGMAVHILNDLNGIWGQDRDSDLMRGKVTLPILYGAHFSHKEAPKIKEWIQKGEISDHAEEILAILEKIDTKKYLVHLALKERETALKHLENCPDETGATALRYLINGVFHDIGTITKN